MHLPGRQIDPRRRSAATSCACALGARDAATARNGYRARRVSDARPPSTSSTAAAPSPRARSAPPRAPTCTGSATPPRTSPSRSSASRTRGSRRCRATSTTACSRRRSRRASARPAARRWSSTRSRSPTGSRWAPPGMRASLVSRELIADSIELVASAHALRRARRRSRGCDKTIPGTVMALARLDIPGLMLYGGSIQPGPLQGRRGDDPAGVRGRRRVRRRARSPRRSCTSSRRPPRRAPARAAASSPRTRWRWPSRCSASRRPARRWCRPRTGASSRSPGECGELVMDVLRRGQRPSDVITKPALENAIAAVAMSGGSTNGVLHLLAVAREMGVPLTIDEFDAISERTPLLCDLQPGGQYAATDLYEAGGVPLVLKRLREAGILQRRRDRRSPAARSASTPTRRRRPTASTSCARSTDPLKADGRLRDPARQRRAGRLRGQARRPRAPQAHAARRACSTARRRRWRRCSRTRSRRATSS